MYFELAWRKAALSMWAQSSTFPWYYRIVYYPTNTNLEDPACGFQSPSMNSSFSSPFTSFLPSHLNLTLEFQIFNSHSCYPTNPKQTPTPPIIRYPSPLQQQPKHINFYIILAQHLSRSLPPFTAILFPSTSRASFPPVFPPLPYTPPKYKIS